MLNLWGPMRKMKIGRFDYMQKLFEKKNDARECVAKRKERLLNGS